MPRFAAPVRLVDRARALSGPAPVLRRILILLAATVLMALPTPAHAHGISSEAADLSVWGFIPLGMEHMILGWDHLAFIAGVLLVARTFKLSLKLISVFVAGHSTTLILATLAGWQVNAGYVDAIIAASVAFVGCVGLIGRPQRWGWFAAVVAGFGLIHGLGLATRFADLGLPPEGQLAKVIAFNVGIEIGQLTAIVGMLGLFAAVSMMIGRARHEMAGKAIAAALVLVGSMAAAVLTYQAFETPDAPVDVALSGESSCTIAERTETFPATGGHTAQAFYGPEEQVPLGDFGHSLNDGYVLVLYPPDTSATALEELQDFMDTPQGVGVLAGPATSGSDAKVMTLSQTMTCPDLDPDAVRDFTTEWNDSRVGG
jgi:hydrogenase/urease accessory protein HupE